MRAAHLLVAAWSQALVTDTSPKFYGILEADTDVAESGRRPSGAAS